MLRATLNQFWLTWKLLRDPRVPGWTKLIPLLALLYLLSPVDIIPDFIFGLGQLDDLGIIFAALRLFEFVVPGYLADEHRDSINRRNQPLDVVDAPSYRVISSEEKREA